LFDVVTESARDGCFGSVAGTPRWRDFTENSLLPSRNGTIANAGPAIIRHYNMALTIKGGSHARSGKIRGRFAHRRNVTIYQRQIARAARADCATGTTLTQVIKS
jgi:hypothetical protein